MADSSERHELSTRHRERPCPLNHGGFHFWRICHCRAGAFADPFRSQQWCQVSLQTSQRCPFCRRRRETSCGQLPYTPPVTRFGMLHAPPLISGSGCIGHQQSGSRLTLAGSLDVMMLFMRPNTILFANRGRRRVTGTVATALMRPVGISQEVGRDDVSGETFLSKEWT